MSTKPKYQFDDSAIESIKQLLSTPKRICIVTHVNPDGDAIGSSVALGNLLSKANHEVNVVTPNSMMEFLKWMDVTENVVSFADKPDLGASIIQNAEIIFCLDFSHLSRFESGSEHLLANKTAIKILIDHHIQPQDFCKFTFSFPEACATAELIYYFIDRLGLVNLIDNSIADCLYCGIMTDSGNFRFDSVTPELHEITANLLRMGANQNKVYELICGSNSIDKMKLDGYVMGQKLEYLEANNAVIISLSDEEQKRFNVGKSEIDDIANFGLKIKGVKISAFFYENDGKLRVSLRSAGNFSVRDIVTKYYNGGGHLNAAGGTSPSGMLETIEHFKQILNEMNMA